MNFNLDDPLADLLSDNDNDSFFDSYKKSSKTLPSKSNRKIDDLFGIKEERTESKASPMKKLDTNTNTQNKPIATSTPRITRQKPSQSNDDADDDNDDLGFDPKKPKVSTKSNLFDDLLGTIETKRPATAKLAISRQSTDTTTDTTTHTQARPKTSTGRRSSGNSAVVNPDPLGLFSTTTSKERDLHVTGSEMSTPKMKKRGTTADWLGLSVEPEKPNVTNTDTPYPESPRTPKAAKTNTIEPKEKVEILSIATKSPETHRRNMADDNAVEHFKVPQTSAPTQNMMLLNSMNLEAQNAFNVLQQQESQLTLATQMKQQEMALMEMQSKQEALLQQQEQQFSALLQQQVQRQQHLEEHIKSQQQRINNHIHLLMTQPTFMAPTRNRFESEEHVEATTKNTVDVPAQQSVLEVVQLEADVKRLELEKLRLEELVENMKVNFDKEMEIIESSFRKQIKVLEDHLSSVEARLKSEIEDLHASYRKKLESLNEEKQNQKTDFEAQLATIKQDYDDDLRRLRKSQEDDLNMLKEEHRRMLEAIRQTKMLEFAAVQENGSYLETLKAASSNLANVSDGLQTLRDDMQMKIETINRDRRLKLDAREKRLEDTEKRLQLTEEMAEEDKRRLMELVSTLEVQLGRQTKESAEENWLLRQKMATLDAERTAFAREKVLMREQFERDEKRIADLKEQQLSETQKYMLELQEERARLSVEKVKFETERRLLPNNDLEKQRAEVEATMQVAQDATRQADAERLRYHRLQRELEQSKRELVDKENMLRAKEEEVEQELQIMRVSERKSLETQQRARVAERNFQAKIKYLQQRTRELGEKEGQLSQEQLLLAQERIKLQNMKTRLGEQKCTLCKMSEQSAEISQMLHATDANDARRTPNSDEAATIRGGEQFRYMLSQGNVVDRMLDVNIAESYRRMRQTTGNGDYWAESVLDDDSKELALHNLDTDFQLNNAETMNK